jgi:hypothetical protein
LVQFSCFLLVRTAGPCFPLTGGICKFYASIFDHWPIQLCLRYQKAKQLLLLGDNLC